MCRWVKRALALTLALALVLTGCAGGPSSADPDAQKGLEPSAPESSADPTPTPEPTPTPTPEPTPEPTPTFPLYEFGTPLAESDPVEDDAFFDTAVYLGDSRTEGLQLFSGLKHGDFYWARGMSVFRADDEKYQLFEIDGQSYTLVGTLSQKTYDSIYIMIGINEMGFSAESYETGLGQLIDKVLAAQPDAVVYLQTLPPVNDGEARANGLADYINNDKVDQFNEAIVRVATEKRVVLLDTASVYRDEDGQLPADLSSDGAHFVYGGYTLWADYLRCHVMDPDRYHYNRSLEPIAPPEPEQSAEPKPSPEFPSDDQPQPSEEAPGS